LKQHPAKDSSISIRIFILWFRSNIAQATKTDWKMSSKL
jgi:hypothetical protein